MVDGIEMVFSKEKMIERLKSEDRLEDLPDEIFGIMNNLDGQPVGTNSWNRRVMGAPVYTCKGKDGKSYDVNEEDCIGKHEFK